MAPLGAAGQNGSPADASVRLLDTCGRLARVPVGRPHPGRAAYISGNQCQPIEPQVRPGAHRQESYKTPTMVLPGGNRNQIMAGRDMSGGPTFASLLRRFRDAANLTQEELAELSGMSVQAISAL